MIQVRYGFARNSHSNNDLVVSLQIWERELIGLWRGYAAAAKLIIRGIDAWRDFPPIVMPRIMKLVDNFAQDTPLGTLLIFKQYGWCFSTELYDTYLFYIYLTSLQCWTIRD